MLLLLRQDILLNADTKRTRSWYVTGPWLRVHWHHEFTVSHAKKKSPCKLTYVSMSSFQTQNPTHFLIEQVFGPSQEHNFTALDQGRSRIQLSGLVSILIWDAYV